MSGAEAARTRLDRLTRAGKIPGAQYLVISPAGVVFDHCSGWADLAGRRPLTTGTTMMAYSMSKPITATAVLQLIDANRLGLDDPVDDHLDEPQPYGPEVTIRQLLSHTAGIPNPIPLRWVHAARDHDGFDERAALALVLRAHSRLSSPPGRRYRYSNIGYWLLGFVVARVSGEPFESYVSRNVLKPLGIGPNELGYSVPDLDVHAKGYLEKFSALNLLKRLVIDGNLIGGYEAGWLHIHDHYVNGAAFGGLVGSARAFGTFVEDQLRPRSVLLSDGARSLLHSPQRAEGGAAIPMTLGWHVDAQRSTPVLYKEGGGGGFRAMMRLYPCVGIGSILMTNATGCNVGALLDDLDAPFL